MKHEPKYNTDTFKADLYFTDFILYTDQSPLLIEM